MACVPRVSLAPKTPFPFPFKRLPRRLGRRVLRGIWFLKFDATAVRRPCTTNVGLCTDAHPFPQQKIVEGERGVCSQPTLTFTACPRLMVQANALFKTHIVKRVTLLDGTHPLRRSVRRPESDIPGGYFRNFWVGMCRRDPGTLSLYQS